MSVSITVQCVQGLDVDVVHDTQSAKPSGLEDGGRDEPRKISARRGGRKGGQINKAMSPWCASVA